MGWIIGGFILTWVAISIEARTVKKERDLLKRELADLRDAMHNSAVDTIGITMAKDAEIREALARVEKFARATDEIAVGTSSRTDRTERDINALRADLTASLNTYHGDRKGDKLKPWRNLPQFTDLATRKP
jgi:hypothetical protein